MDKTFLVVLLVASLAGCANAPPVQPAQSVKTANDEHWLEVGGFELRKGSFEFKKNNKDMPLATVILRNRYKGKAYFLRVGLSAEDCGRGVGKLLSWDLDGKVVDSYGYVRNGGTNGSALGDFICGVADKIIAENNERDGESIESAARQKRSSSY